MDVFGGRQQQDNNDNAYDVQMDLFGYDSQYDRIPSSELYPQPYVRASPSKQSPNCVPIELIDVNMDEISEGPVPSHDNICIAIEPTRSTSEKNLLNSQEHRIQSFEATIVPSLNGKLN